MIGGCSDCQRKRIQIASAGPAQKTGEATRAAGKIAQSYFEHDFSRVAIHTSNAASDARRTLVINGPNDAPKPAPDKKESPPAKGGARCPTVIRVADVGPATDRDFGKNGFLTGWGGLSQMEVSDPSGGNWDGTAIQESLKRIKNSCGDRGKNACSNVSSDQEKSAAGSTFIVGAESNFLGKAKLAAKQNRFYDLHVFASKDASLLHELKKDTCEVQCQQSYSCGGKRLGTDFVITYTMTRDVVQSGSKNINVTRVAVNKAAAAKQEASGG